MQQPVQPLQVFGVPDQLLGEEVCAFVVLKPGYPRSLCQPRIAHYKIPRPHVRFVAEFPMTATGKPQKFMMRREMISELNLSEAGTTPTH
jgi:fatty-acyl-CoA synthase